MKTKLFTLLAILIGINATAQDVNNIQMPELLNETKRVTINIPDIMGYKTLKCDFHMHTVFSDGRVWPTVRVNEAWQEGLDAIAITDHIENYPSKKHVGGDDNSSYEIALAHAKQKNIILIRGGEITRSMPPGHFNALFLNDVNALDTPDYMDAFRAAANQGAFILWCHPGWKAQQPDTTLWWDVHTTLFENGWLHGIEVFNEKEWYPIALEWCVDKNLTVFANSDIHGITAGMYNLKKYHRPLTLVFAESSTEKAIKEALFAKRTVAWFGNNLAGEEEFLKAIFNEAVSYELIRENNKSKTLVFKNSSDVPFFIKAENGKEFTIPANGENMVDITKNCKCKITNLYIYGLSNLELQL